MSNSRVFSLLCLVTFLALAVVVPVTAQQGWSQANAIKAGGKEATLNSVFYDGDEVWVVGADGFVATSFDDGRTFQEMDLGIDAGLNEVSARKDRVWIVGDGGTILLSTDGGRSFVKSLYNSYRKGLADAQGGSDMPDLYSVQFADGDSGFIVGDEGLVLATNNGGATWREQRSGTSAQLFQVSVKGEDAWAVGTGGVIIRTNDGGRNWYPQRSGTSEDLNRVYFVTDRVGVITGENGTLLRTENGGATWERVSLSLKEPLYGISFTDKKTGWVVGYKGRVVRTYDGGRNWVEQESGTAVDLFSVSFFRNRGYAIGRDGLVMRYYEKR